MIGLKLKNGFLDFGKSNFKCPNCKAKYDDNKNKYLKRCNNNKCSFTKINCKCGNKFYFTYNYLSEATTFLKKN